MRKLIPFFALLGALAVHASPFSDAFEPYKKIDRAADQPAFAKFRADLLQVVGRRDAQALKGFLSPQIHYSFGVEKPGVEGFYSAWKATDRNSELWKQLAQVISNGGSFDPKGQFVAPSWYANWPADHKEAEWGVVSDARVKVYLEPKDNAKTLPEIGPCWVRLNQNHQNETDSKFTCIDLPKSMQNPFKVESAFVKSRQVHHLLDYRAVFTRRNGRWELSSFLAGD